MNWRGVSFEIESSFAESWSKSRKNPLLIEDATQADYVSILSDFPRVIDYLSLDIDGKYDIALKRIPFDDYTFKIITIEHDSYRFGKKYKEKQRAFSSKGYHLLCPDVSHFFLKIEDWWIHPSFFPPSALAKLKSLNLKGKEHKDIVRLINLHFRSNVIN